MIDLQSDLNYNTFMRNYKLEPVQEQGSGIVRIGKFSVEAEWFFDGLQRYIEVPSIEDGSWVKNGFDYGAYSFWFAEQPEGLPEVGTNTSIMIDDRRIGSDNEWWVSGYLASNNKLGVELSNRPIARL